FCLPLLRRPPSSHLFPYPPLFRSDLTRPRTSPRRAIGSDRMDGGEYSSPAGACPLSMARALRHAQRRVRATRPGTPRRGVPARRSEEHTSELQSRENLVCRLLLEK